MRGVAWRGVASVVLVMSVVCATFASGTAGASTVVPCAARVTSTPFTKWGDSTPYFLMPAGNFESAGAGWGFASGSGVVVGNESFQVGAATDSHSASIPTGSTVTSPTICLGRGELMVRLFTKAPAVTGTALKVQATLQNPSTGQVVSTTFTISSMNSSAWAPTIQMRVPNLLGGSTGTENLTLKFSTSGSSGTWNVDDVYVDPFKVR